MSSPPRPVVAPTALAAVGALPVLCLVPEALRAGGLAPLFCAAVVTGFFGAPLALREWRSGEERRDPVRDALAETTLTTWTAAAVASLAVPWQGGGQLGAGAAFAAATALGALFAGQVLVRTRPGRFVAGAALGVMVAAASWPVFTVDATSDRVPALPWTLLEPHFESWRAWAPGAVVLGVVGAGAASGSLSLFRREPGERRAPFAAAGVGLALALVLSVRAGAAHAAALGQPASDAVALGLGAAALALAGPVTSLRPLFVALAAGWLCGPAAGALPFVTSVVAPALSAALCLRIAWTSTGVDRIPSLAGGALLTVAAGLGPWPSEPSAAVAIGGLVVVVFWWVATRLVTAPQEAT
jgi:hypothetical protein